MAQRHDESTELAEPIVRKRKRSALRNFLRGEALGGIVLMGAAALGLIAANSPITPFYFAVLHTQIAALSVLHWINDGLMALFFLLIGLEVKRELVDGQLSTWSRRVLPGLAALGGMIVPAVIYLVVTRATPAVHHGWATPTATDIAFTLGVIALLQGRAPASLVIFVTALAIIDDLGAIVIIAVFFTANLALGWLLAAAGVLLGLVLLNRRKVSRLWPYVVGAALLWFCMLHSGVHATLAGVAAAFTIPLTPSPATPDDRSSPLFRLEHALHPWVAFAVVPLFGFANAGVSFTGLTFSALLEPVAAGVALDLFLGKQIGVFSFTWLAVRLRLADCPEHASWLQVYGVSVLCGVGFTMSLFIGLLAFPTAPELQDSVKLGVLVGSAASTLVGAALLLAAKPQTPTSVRSRFA